MDVWVKHKVTGEIIEMSEYSFNLNRDEYSLIGEEVKVNKRPVIEPEQSAETLGSEGIPSLLADPEKPKSVRKTKK